MLHSSNLQAYVKPFWKIKKWTENNFTKTFILDFNKWFPGSDCKMIPDIFLGDRQLISLVAHIGHLLCIYSSSERILHWYIASPPRKRFASTEIRAREENPGLERSKKLAGA